MDDFLEIQIIKNGLEVLIQDEGRRGMQSMGIPCCGPMDRYSARLANLILGQTVDHPVIELALMGPKIHFSKTAQISITGADLSPMINGDIVEMNKVLAVPNNAVLSFGKRNYGCRSYLGIAGMWQIEKLVNSYCPIHVNDGKLNENRILKKGTVLKILQQKQIAEVDLSFQTGKPDLNPIIRVLPGPEFEKIHRVHIADFFSREYRLSNDSNRMGYRLNDPIPDFKSDFELISSATLPGTIQITNDGTPVILMYDAQTTGGYPRIANVITADMDLLGQKAPGDALRFQLVTHAEAIEAFEFYHSKLPFN